MEESKLFKRIWRFNAIVLALAGLGVLLALAVISFLAFRDLVGERRVYDVVNIAALDEQVKESWRFGSLQHLEGTPYLRLPLYSSQQYGESYYSKSTESARNYLFINRDNNQKYWLFEHNRYLITRAETLYQPIVEHEQQSSKALAVLYLLIKEDTNADGRLSAADQRTLAITAPGGQGYRELISGVDRPHTHLLDDKRLLIVYQREDGSAYSAEVSLEDFTLTAEEPLPEVGG